VFIGYNYKSTMKFVAVTTILFLARALALTKRWHELLDCPTIFPEDPCMTNSSICYNEWETADQSVATEEIAQAPQEFTYIQPNLTCYKLAWDDWEAYRHCNEVQEEVR